MIDNDGDMGAFFPSGGVRFALVWGTFVGVIRT